SLFYALSALTCFYMSSNTLQAEGAEPPDSWDSAGHYFLDECIHVRKLYGLVQDFPTITVVMSFWLSVSLFEIGEAQKSWGYLQEALNLALELGLQKNSSYFDLSSEAILWHQRCFWQLLWPSVQRSSFTLLRGKSIVPKTTIILKKTLEPTTGRYLYKSRDISLRFLQLVSLYLPPDESFVTAWNGSSAPRVGAETNLAPQNHLAGDFASIDIAISSDGPQSSEPTDIQRFNLLITQHWLRLIVWQSSLRQGLISWRAPDKTLHFAFPLTIACRTASLLATLPRSAVQVPGTSIFEKIFEIGISCINFLDACAANLAISGVSVTNVTAGFLDGIEWRNGAVTIDPVELFVKALSSNPNSLTQFAWDLRLFASMRPRGMKITLTP
ncbi:hypothetical protein B0T24DRAFT_513711, partial [Lasiosphaeria ovina]